MVVMAMAAGQRQRGDENGGDGEKTQDQILGAQAAEPPPSMTRGRPESLTTAS